ncbi:hypothetical protein ACLVWU_16890 [Bdellovibrio sp. HCB290]|uniref:hypothetical protein n=1 Tax=Bdellovibrio sp. HCB290 TaxID=3394356 RepID=UPI0039B5D3E9
MKALLVSILVLLAGAAQASEKEYRRIHCEGTATIQGSIFKKKESIVLDFNVNGGEVYKVAHIAQIGEVQYGHDEGISWCERASTNTVLCYGSGYGDGPELKVNINLISGKASGTYFNPWASLGIEVPNEYNTYQFTDLKCR